MEKILLAYHGLRVKAGCMEMQGGTKVTVVAERLPFRRGRYSVAIDDFKGNGDTELEGQLPRVAGRLSRMEHARALVGILSRVACAVSDPAPLFGPKRSWREEGLTRHFTDKEIAILASLTSGIRDPAVIRSTFGLGRARMFFGRLELGASSLVHTPWEDGLGWPALTESGKKLMEKAREEPPMREALGWAAALGPGVQAPGVSGKE